MKISLVFLILTFPFIVYAQEVRIKDDSSGTDRHLQENEIVKDVNGEICSLAIISCKIEGVKFYSNLSIEKIIFTDQKYYVWFPYDASLLKIVIPGYPLIEHPVRKTNKPSVYVLIITITDPEIKRIYKTDSTSGKITIICSPYKARVYDKDFFIGFTPIGLDYISPHQTEGVELRKTGYLPYYIPWDTLSPNSRIDVALSPSNSQQNFLISVSYGRLLSMPKAILGIQAGRTGSPGYYISGKMALYDDPEVFGYSRMQGYTASAGMNFPFLKFMHLNIGLGYCYSDAIIDAEIDERDIETGFVKYRTLMYEIGLMIRTGKNGKVLFWPQFNFLNNKGGEAESMYDISFGIGYAF